MDNRLVVLLKSLRTNNRFYTLVEPESGLKNADTIEEFAAGLPLGIAYPCLEDGLNDFAVIRTTFETIEVFPDDDELRGEMMSIINDARGNLVRRLEELRDSLLAGQAHFLGTDLQEFKDHIVHMATRGAPRRTLDNMMKLDVFESVSKSESAGTGRMPEPMYRYEFLDHHSLEQLNPIAPRQFIGRLFDDVLDSVTDDSNYGDRGTFDKSVFQKFIAVMFTNYATTDPVFYGTSREDYGVSSDKDMQETPLYQAIAQALRTLEREGDAGPRRAQAPPPEEQQDLSYLFGEDGPGEPGPFDQAAHALEIPFGAADRMLLEPLRTLTEAARLLKTVDHPRAGEIRTMIRDAGHQLFRNMQELKILSPLLNDPTDGADR